MMLNSVKECIKDQQERGGVELGYALYELHSYNSSEVEIKFEREIEFYKKLKEGRVELLGFSFTTLCSRPKVITKEY